MATKIRLRRMGARNNPFYRLVVADSRFATTGRYLEVLGWYDPKQAEKNFSVHVERADYWLGTGAQMSDTAKSLIEKARAGEGVPYGASPETKKIDTQALIDAVPDKTEAPAPAVEEAPVQAEAEETPVDVPDEPSAEEAVAVPVGDAPEKQES